MEYHLNCRLSLLTEPEHRWIIGLLIVLSSRPC